MNKLRRLFKPTPAECLHDMLRMKAIIDDAPESCLDCKYYVEPDPMLPSWVEDWGSCSIHPELFSTKTKCPEWISDGARQALDDKIQQFREALIKESTL